MYLNLEQFIVGVGKEDFEMGMERCSGQTEQHIKEDGYWVKQTVKELLNILMGIFMKVSGKIICHKEKEHTSIKMELSLLGNGLMMFSMGWDVKNGLMDQYLKGCISLDENKVWECIDGMIVHNSLEIGKIVKFQGWVYMNGLMGDNIMENGLITICMDLESINGRITENMKVSI